MPFHLLSRRPLLAFVAVLSAAGLCTIPLLLPQPATPDAARNGLAAAPRQTLDPRAVALSPHSGTQPLDVQIRAMQERIAATPQGGLLLQRLGELFIAKARLSNDPGFYKLAEQSALALEAVQPENLDALLLRGHALAAMHQFREAEAIARRLIGSREYVLDHALLGDALMEQGRLNEAIPAYQQMADLKPGLQAYTRISHLRWLKGDLEGASEMMELAIEAGTPRLAEPVAWATARLAAYRLQAGNLAEAHQLCTRALQLVPEYAPALLVQGRVLLAEGKPVAAIAPLELAAARNPLPEVQWILADALRAAGESERAVVAEQKLEASGAGADPRSYSLYLATRDMQSPGALRLAQREMEDRRDIFTHDALAWAQHANGQRTEALASIQQALSEGTQDARLFLHAGIIHAAAGQPDAAWSRLQQASALRAMLFPSESALLDQHLANARPPADPPSLTSNKTNPNDHETKQ